MKKFKSKRKHHFIKLIVYVLILYLSYQLTFNILFDFKLEKNNKEFIKSLLYDSNHHIIYNKRHDNLLSKCIRMFTSIDSSSPATVLATVFDYKIKTSSDEEETDNILSEYIEDPNPINIDNPRVYIYNTHQLEGYNAVNYADYGITPNVQMASYLLKDRLNSMNIPTIVESNNISQVLKANGWNYADSYKASRSFIEENLKKYNSLDLIIDLHRDSIAKDSSTVEIDNKKYAKVLFVVGKKYADYNLNLELANNINNLIKQKYPNLTRGVILKDGKDVNGIYNQDLSSKILLIECGSVENTIDEVINTVDIISKIMKEYLGE